MKAKNHAQTIARIYRACDEALDAIPPLSESDLNSIVAAGIASAKARQLQRFSRVRNVWGRLIGWQASPKIQMRVGFTGCLVCIWACYAAGCFHFHFETEWLRDLVYGGLKNIPNLDLAALMGTVVTVVTTVLLVSVTYPFRNSSFYGLMFQEVFGGWAAGNVQLPTLMYCCRFT